MKAPNPYELLQHGSDLISPLGTKITVDLWDYAECWEMARQYEEQLEGERALRMAIMHLHKQLGTSVESWASEEYEKILSVAERLHAMLPERREK